MTRKKAVKVRKWVTCCAPGCKRRARVSSFHCGACWEQIKKKDAAEDKKKNAAAKKRKKVVKVARAGVKRFLATKEGRAAKWAAAKKGKAQPKKPARKKSQKEIMAAVKKRREYAGAKRAVRKKTKSRRAGKAAVVSLSRLIKAYCEKCGYTIRLSKKWIEVRRPICPVCEKNMVTELDHVEPDPRQLPLKKVKKGGV